MDVLDHFPSNGYSPSGNDLSSPSNGYFYSGNHQPQSNGYFHCGMDNGYFLSPTADTGYFPSGNPLPPSNSVVFAGNGFYGNYPQSEGSPYETGISNYEMYLESVFNCLSLSSPLSPYSTNLQRVRPQSTVLNYRLNCNYGRSDDLESGTSSFSSFLQRLLILGGPISELRGKIVSAAKEQYGCRFLQSKLGNLEDIRLIFSEAKDHICDLMTDRFGNYLMQKFFGAVDEDQMNQLLYVLITDERRFKGVCTDMYGTRAVQKLLEHLTTQDQRALVVSVLRRITLSLIKNHNGQHVVQHCLKYFPPEDNKHILIVVANNCIDVATDKSGCCVIQQCLTHSVGESLDLLIAQIISNAHILSENSYGNYVVQYILGFRIQQVTSEIMMQLSGHFVSLSLNKFGSNVIEQFLKQSRGDEALPILDELIRYPNILRVFQDAYGNYVAQCALIVASNNELLGAAFQALMRLVDQNYPFLHSHRYGKRVLAVSRTLGFKSRS